MLRKPRITTDYALVYQSHSEPATLPEVNLLSALLIRAIRDLTEPNADILDIYRQDAIEWFYSGESVPFSFEWCCQEVSIDPDFLAKQIEAIGVIYPNNWRVMSTGKGTRGIYNRIVKYHPVYTYRYAKLRN